MPADSLGGRGAGRHLWLGYLAAGVALLGGQVLLSGGVADALYAVTSVTSVLAILLGVTVFRPVDRRSWHLLAASQAMFALGDARLLLTHEALGLPLGLVSPADLAWLLAQGLLLAGLLGLLRAQGTGSGRLAVLDGAVTAVVVCMLGWVYLVAPMARVSDADLLPQLLAEGYPAPSTLALVLALHLTLRGPARGTVSRCLLLAGTVSGLLGVVVWSRLLLTGQEAGTLLTLCWQVNYLGMGAAALHPSMRGEPVARREERGERQGSMALLMACAALAPAVVLLESVRRGYDVLSVVAISALAVFLLVLARVVTMNTLLRDASAAALVQQTDHRFRRLVQASSDLIVIVKEGAILYATPSVGSRLGHSIAGLVGAPLTTLMSEQDARRLHLQVAAESCSPEGGREGRRVECTLRTVDGTAVPVEALCGTLDDDVLGGLVLTMRDVGERRQLEDQLRRTAYTDALTGVPNRAFFRNRLALLLAEPQALGALLVLDLDDFKVVNDLYGHAYGDALLVETTRRLLLSCQEFEDAFVARLGGDEFALVLPDVSFGEARWVCASLVNRLRQPVAIAQTTFEVGTSIGLVMIEERRSDVEELLRDADLAMYAAKAAGKNSWLQFDPSMHDDLVQRLTLESELRAALAGDQLEVHYQPLVTLTERRLTGVEALVRWRHPTRGMISPEEFIPVAERSSLIEELGTWVLGTACRQLVQWSDDFGGGAPDQLGVNVSPRQLLDPGFPAIVARTLADTGLAPSRLVLEITESMVMEDDLSERQLSQLRDLGVQLSIDDFGTGHSSLARLGHLPVGSLKIDRSFVRAIPAEGEAPLVRAIVSMAHSLGLSVVAEGVETERQRRYLTGLGCEHGQGFLFSRPCSAAALGPLLRAAADRDAVVTRLADAALVRAT